MNPSDILPHEPPMLMLSNVQHCDETTVHCTSVIKDDNPLLQDGFFPTYGGLELLAQASGVLLGSNNPNDVVRPGAIVQIKSFGQNNRMIPVGSTLNIHSTLLGGSSEAALFKGEVFFDEHQFFCGTLMIALLPEEKL